MKNGIKLKAGASEALNVKEPRLFITGTGRNTFLWIGNDAYGSKWCYATLSGQKTLQKFAKEILKATK